MLATIWGMLSIWDYFNVVLFFFFFNGGKSFTGNVATMKTPPPPKLFGTQNFPHQTTNEKKTPCLFKEPPTLPSPWEGWKEALSVIYYRLLLLCGCRLGELNVRLSLGESSRSPYSLISPCEATAPLLTGIPELSPNSISLCVGRCSSVIAYCCRWTLCVLRQVFSTYWTHKGMHMRVHATIG